MTPVTGEGRSSRAFPTEHRSKPSPEWNHYRITCVDGEISLAVNGKVVTRGKDCKPRKGYICLESEGGVVATECRAAARAEVYLGLLLRHLIGRGAGTVRLPRLAPGEVPETLLASLGFEADRRYERYVATATPA